MSAKPIQSLEQPSTMYNLYFDESSQLLIAGGEKQILFYDKNIQPQQFPFTDSIAGQNNVITSITSYQDSIFIANFEAGKTVIYQLNTPITENSQAIRQLQGSVLAMTAYQNILAYADNNNIVLFNLETQSEVAILQAHTGTIYDLKFNPKATKLASASKDKTVRLWDLSNNQSEKLIIHQDAVSKIAFNHQGNLLASASYDKTVQLLDLENQNNRTLHSHKAAVLGVAFSQDDKFLISASKDTTLHIFDVGSGKALRVLEGHQDQVNALAVVDKYIYSVGGDSQLKQWDLTLGMQWVQLERKPRSVSISSQNIAIGYENGSLAIYTMDNFEQPLWEIPAHDAAIKYVQFNPKSNLLATLDTRHILKLWQAETGILSYNIAQAANSMAFSDDNQYLAFAGNNGEIGLLSLKDNSLQTYSTPIKSLKNIAFHPNNKELAISGVSSQVYIWRVENEKFVLHSEITDVPKQINNLNYSHDGAQLAVVGANPNTPYFYDTTEYAKLMPVGDSHTETIAKAIFAPNNQHVATVGADNTIRFWNLNYELFTIPLPLRDTFSDGYDIDFDFQCAGKCPMVVPLKDSNSILIYDLGAIYSGQ